MKTINHIAKYNSLILIIGMIAAFGIISQPIFQAHANCEIINSVDERVLPEQHNNEKETPSDAQISTFEAVAPTAQIQLTPLDFILADQPNVETQKSNTLVKLAVQLPEKLLRVLFNMIIAPNAP